MTHTQATPVPSLADVALLVAMRSGVWDPMTTDKARTVETLAGYGASDSRAAALRKRLIPAGFLDPEADPYRIRNAARQEHYRLSLPYGAQRGVQLLPAVLLMDYSKRMADYRVRFEYAADALCKRIPEIKAAVQRTYGKLYSEADYPDPSDIRARFTFDFDRMPLPTGGGALSTLTDPLADRLREYWEGRIRADVAEAQAAALDRAKDALQHLAHKLSEYDPANPKSAPFRDSTVQAVQDIASLLPSFNVLRDADTEAVADSLRTFATRGAADSFAGMLRTEERTRADAATEAKRIAINAGNAAKALRQVAAAPAPSVSAIDASAGLDPDALLSGALAAF